MQIPLHQLYLQWNLVPLGSYLSGVRRQRQRCSVDVHNRVRFLLKAMEQGQGHHFSRDGRQPLGWQMLRAQLLHLFLHRYLPVKEYGRWVKRKAPSYEMP